MSAIRQRSHTSPPGRAVLVALLAASVVIRVLYFQELSRGPCIWQHRWSETDMYFFDRWARSIAAGDWLTERPLHPHTIWQRPIAEAYLAERPQGATAVMDEGPAGDPSLQPWEMVWDHWYGGRCFHQEPLYPYLVALTYRALGPDVRWVFVWQMAIGVLTNVLVYEIARRHFGERVGRLAGLLAVLCGPMLFYETILLRETLITFAGVALVFLVDRAAERGRWRSWLLAGVAFGLALLLRTTFLVMLAGVLAWMAWGTRPANAVGPRARARNAAALACGAALCLLPAVARNVAVGAPAACLSGVGPITFLAANAEDYPTDRGFWVSRHTAEIMVKADGRLLPVVVETLRTHPGPASYLRQLAAKFGAVWHWYEKPNNENFYYYRLHASVLRFLPVTFLLIAPLSAVGLVLAARRLRQHAALYLLVVTTVAQLLLFYVISRLRVPLAPALLPFAALTIVSVAEWLRRGRWPAAAAAVAGVVVVACWTAHPLPGNLNAIRPADYIAPFLVYYGPLEQAATQRADWRGAADVLADVLAREPDFVRELGASRPARTPDEAKLAAYFGHIRERHAGYLAQAGEAGGAAEERRRAQELIAAGQSR